jgi:hypothetical protein
LQLRVLLIRERDLLLHFGDDNREVLVVEIIHRDGDRQQSDNFKPESWDRWHVLEGNPRTQNANTGGSKPARTVLSNANFTGSETSVNHWAILTRECENSEPQNAGSGRNPPGALEFRFWEFGSPSATLFISENGEFRRESGGGNVGGRL